MRIAVASGKGGTGKTTVATSLALSLNPTRTLLLDCDVEISASRVGKRESETEACEGVERYDGAGLDVHRKIRQGFLELVDRFPDRVVKIDASQSSDKILADAMAFLRDRGLP